MNIISYKENVQFLEDEKRKADIAELQKNVTGMRKSIKIISEILYSISKRAAADAEKYAVALSKLEGK